MNEPYKGRDWSSTDDMWDDKTPSLTNLHC